jgi:hypothetical protein
VPRSVLCDRRTLGTLESALHALPHLDVFVADGPAAITAISGYELHSGALAIGERRPEPDAPALAALGVDLGRVLELKGLLAGDFGLGVAVNALGGAAKGGNQGGKKQ